MSVCVCVCGRWPIGAQTRGRASSPLGLENVRVDYTLDATRCGPSRSGHEATANATAQGPHQSLSSDVSHLHSSGGGPLSAASTSRLNFSVRAPPAAFAGRWVCVADDDSTHSNEVGFRIYGAHIYQYNSEKRRVIDFANMQMKRVTSTWSDFNQYTIWHQPLQYATGQ